MIQITPVWIVILVIFIACFIALAIFSTFRLNNLPKENRSFMRAFPSEIYDNKFPLSNVYRPIIFVYCALCFSPLAFIVPNISKLGDVGIIGTVVTIVFGIQGILLVSLFLFHIRYTSAHMKLATFYMACSFLTCSLTGVYLGLTYKTWLKFDKATVLSLILTIIAGILAIIVLIFIFNPKLKDWAKLFRSNDGEEAVYSRPKKFPLAYTEWSLILINFIAELIFIIGLVR